MYLAHFLSLLSNFENIGSLAGIVEHLGMYPVDTIKVTTIVSILFIDAHAGLRIKADLIHEYSEGLIRRVGWIPAVLERCTSNSDRVLASRCCLLHKL